MSRNLVISKYCELLLLDRHCLSFFLLLHWFSNHRLLVKPLVHTYIRLLNHCLVKLCQFAWVDHRVSLLPWLWSLVVHFRADLWLEVFLNFFFFSEAFVLHHFLFRFSSFFDVFTHSIQKFLLLLFAHFLTKIMSFSFYFHDLKFFLKLLQFLFFKDFLVSHIISLSMPIKEILDLFRCDFLMTFSNSRRLFSPKRFFNW